MDAVCRSDRMILADTYQYDDSADDVFEREPYAVKFLFNYTLCPSVQQHQPPGTPFPLFSFSLANSYICNCYKKNCSTLSCGVK